MFLCCWRICVVCLALELVGPWVVLGFTVGMEAFDELLSLNVPWSQVFYDSQDLDLSLLFLVFSLIFTVASRLPHLYGTDDKSSAFEDIGLLFWCLMSSTGIKNLFCGIYSLFKCSFDEFLGEKVVSPSYCSDSSFISISIKYQ